MESEAEKLGRKLMSLRQNGGITKGQGEQLISEALEEEARQRKIALVEQKAREIVRLCNAKWMFVKAGGPPGSIEQLKRIAAVLKEIGEQLK